ncbi:MAG: HEPN domain-containing protein [Defluviitaleaceae bacterium]|nr:HEPN domain-containing protein [Defluviitaleaceae bacterium]
MKEKDLELLFKMNHLCKELVEDFKGVNKHDFFETKSMVRKAFSYDLIQIGELANKKNVTLTKESKKETADYLSSEFFNKNKGLKHFSWRRVYGIRCKLAHGGVINSQDLWHFCEKKIPLLLKYTNKILEEVREQEQQKQQKQTENEKPKPIPTKKAQAPPQKQVQERQRESPAEKIARAKERMAGHAEAKASSPAKSKKKSMEM